MQTVLFLEWCLVYDTEFTFMLAFYHNKHWIIQIIITITMVGGTKHKHANSIPSSGKALLRSRIKYTILAYSAVIIIIATTERVEGVSGSRGVYVCWRKRSVGFERVMVVGCVVHQKESQFQFFGKIAINIHANKIKRTFPR